jgi:hypothetical protein
MGLTISYVLSSTRDLATEDVLRLAEQVAAFAKSVGCAEIHGPLEGGPDHVVIRELPNGNSTGDFIGPDSGWFVAVLPGEKSESANFGLCRYKGIDRWQLTGWCKTQYAAKHGVEHFIACHRRIISILDFIRDLGVEVDVTDEGEFWETRSLDRLKQRLGVYDRIVAATAGMFKDAGDGKMNVEAAIFDDVRFERLEAEGRDQFASQFDELRGLLQSGKLIPPAGKKPRRVE